MGNYMSCAAASSHGRSAGGRRIRVMHVDGTIEELSRPVFVAELMLDHPQHFVWQFDDHAFHDHEKQQQQQLVLMLSSSSALSADVQLQFGQLYCLLPCQTLKAGVHSSQDDVNFPQTTTAKGSNPTLRFHSLVGLLDLLKAKQKTSDRFLSSESESDQSTLSEEIRDEASKMPDEDDLWDADLEEDISKRLRVMSKSRSWRPKLQTIEELGGLPASC